LTAWVAPSAWGSAAVVLTPTNDEPAIATAMATFLGVLELIGELN
jgi:hypothetical protein